MKYAKTIFEAIEDTQASGNIEYLEMEAWTDFMEVAAKTKTIESMISTGDYDAAREILSGMVDMCFESGPQASLIATLYERMKDYAQAISVLGTYMALRSKPHEFPYRQLARLLKKQGNERTSAAMLEAGWAFRKKGLRRSEQEKAKQEYFSVVG